MDQSPKHTSRPAEKAPVYTVTIYAAAPGTPVEHPGQPAGRSAAGHMYYRISDGNLQRGYGFSPIEPGATHGPGKIVRDEFDAYRNPAYARTLEISRAQYDKLAEFGEAGANRRQVYFNLHYNGATNSCIDFTWKALEHAGLYRHQQPRPGELQPRADRDYDGALRPVQNREDIRSIPAPLPASPHNREQTHPLPERAWWQKLITGQPAAEQAPLSSTLRSLDDPRHAQIVDAVQRLDAAKGREWDADSARLSFGLMNAVAANPAVRRVDEVVLSAATPDAAAGTRAFAVYRPFGEAAPAFHTAVDVRQAVATPVESHLRGLEAAQRDHTLAASAPQMQRGPAHALSM